MKRRVASLAGEISSDYKASRSLALVAVACGALVFASDLMRALDLRLTLDLVFARSYEGTRSVGEVVSKLELRHGVAGRDVLLLDDILDSGRTLSKLSAELKVLNPASLRTCVLLDKPSRRVVPFKADYVGFEIDDVFVVGYGLDYDGYYRNLPYIGGPPPLEPG